MMLTMLAAGPVTTLSGMILEDLARLVIDSDRFGGILQNFFQIAQTVGSL